MMSTAEGFSLDRIDKNTLRYKDATYDLNIPVDNSRGLVVHLSRAVQITAPPGTKTPTAIETALIQQHIQKGLDFMWTRCEFR